MDDAVVRRAQRGEHAAFRLIVDEAIDRLYAVASLIARDHTLAEDAVQDALLRAWRDLPTLRDPTRLDAWLGRLTMNATYDVLRRHRRVRELRPLLEDSAVTSDSAPGSVDRALLDWAYGRLPPEQRAVVVLHYYAGLTLDEAAAHLGIPPGTVRSRLHAALGSMRRWIDSDAGAREPAGGSELAT